LTREYGVKTPLVTFAKRYTFVIGKDRKVLHVDSGGDAIDPGAAMEACRLY
jgi:thioredoxin-dependent peroxiredoxin